MTRLQRTLHRRLWTALLFLIPTLLAVALQQRQANVRALRPVLVAR